MICLTGDVHHASLRINDQKFLPSGETEVQIAGRYVALLEKYGVKATLYVCGKCFVEEWDDLKPCVLSPLVEVGGHGYRTRDPRPLFDWYGERTGNWNGPRAYQDWDIRRMSEVCRERTGSTPVAWRAHSLKVDANTYPLLAKHGYRLVSDEISARKTWPEKIEQDLISHPMNVLPDHDHLFHAHRTPEYVEKANAAGYGADDFGAVSYSIEEWGEKVLAQVRAIEERGGVATILAHPICMYLADNFQTFEKLLKVFADSHCIHAREILPLLEKQEHPTP
jgi:peptidoglycan/xylan/chitin deacetylase (PgdA/CDA1 family)